MSCRLGRPESRDKMMMLVERAAIVSDSGSSELLAQSRTTLVHVPQGVIVELFGGRSIPVASVKGAIGESGAAGAAGLIAGLLSVANDVTVPTSGFGQADPALGVSVSSGPQPVDGDAFLVNSVASGGTNYSVAVRVTRGRS